MRKILLPPLVFILGLGGMWAVNHYGLASAVLLSAPWTYAGALLVPAGIGIVVWARYVFHRHDTNILPYKDPDHMVTTGPFRLTRNPMYLGLLLVLFGVAFLYGTALSIVFPLLFFLIANRWYIPFEEARMAACFGEKFTAYKATVRRWL